MNQELIYQMAVSNLNGIGFQRMKEIYKSLGSFEEFIKLDKNDARQILSVPISKCEHWNYSKEIAKAETEIEFCEKNNIQISSFTHQSYPYRLKECHDAPSVLFSKGQFELNQSKIIAVVGTRNISNYGIKICEDLIAELKNYNCTVISGLAFGVDVKIHQLCLENNIPTIGVLAHGLDRLYPQVHHKIATKMIQNAGGLITEFPINTNPDRENFPKRNRIVAGLVDAVIVVESGEKGGSLITCDLANGYNRDVFAYPGNVFSKYSKGCHHLIRENRANLITSGKDFVSFMGWNIKKEPKETQTKLFVELTEFQQKIVGVLRKGKLSIDQISVKLNMSISKLTVQLLELELKGVVKSLPGNNYENV